MASVNPQPINLSAVNPKVSRVLGLLFKLFALIPLLLGLGFLGGASYSIVSRYNIVKKWPTVESVVTRSQLANHVETMSDKNGSRDVTVYEARIEFQYTLDGKDYTTPTGSDYSSSNYASMKHKVDVFAPGTHHLIRYNPENPNDIRYDASLTFGYFMTPIIFGVIGLVAFLFGVGMFTAGRRIGKAKVRCPSCAEMVSAAEGNCPLCGSSLASAPFPGSVSPAA